MESIALLISVAMMLLEKAGALRQTLSRKGELTAEQEKELDDKIAAARSHPAWQVRPNTPTTPT